MILFMVRYCVIPSGKLSCSLWLDKMQIRKDCSKVFLLLAQINNLGGETYTYPRIYKHYTPLYRTII